jgi:hypothetical protein
MRIRSVLTLCALATGFLVVLTGSPAHAATIPTGASSLESVNYPGRYVRHLSSLARIDPAGDAQSKLDATFTVVNGLASPACYSFQTKDGRFLRHQDWRLRVDANTGEALFRADATFCPVDGSVAGSVSLASYGYPARRIRHRDFALWLDTYQDTAQFRADSSFRITAPWSPKSTVNPVIPGLFADPHLAYFGGRYYLYPTTDGYAGWGGTYYKAFSSADLVTWTDHGVILDHGPDVSWADNSAWAPAVAAKNGRYYLYFSGGLASGNTAKQLGVAVADSPTGPFRDALGRPLVTSGQFAGGQAIDPAVFTDDDGRSYLYWGQGVARVVPLNADMTSFDPAQARTITPAGYNEAPFVFKRNGTYYFMWSENDTRSEDYRVAYATGSSPTGPWTNRGVVLQKRLAAGIRGTGHHSVVQGPGGEWYVAYHRFAVPAGNGTNRETAVDRMEFNADGTLRPIIPTL